jgi:hypothetical protein
MRDFGHLIRSFRSLAVALGTLVVVGLGGALLTGCAAPAAAAPTAQEASAVAAPVAPGATSANLAGARCQGALCTCRSRAGDPAEKSPPDEGHKRFEIRLGGGGQTLTSPTLGTLVSNDGDSCFYVDVVPGSTHELTFTAREARKEEGVSPVLEIAEYGPKGPWWYDVLLVKCAGTATAKPPTPGARTPRRASAGASIRAGRR